MGKCLIDSSIYPVMNEHELLTDEKLVYIYLVICPNRKMHGLFEINMLEVAYMTGLNKDRVHQIFVALQNHSLIAYSNRLVFVPIIPQIDNFIGRIQKEGLDLNKKQFISTYSRYANYRGETTAQNKAYQAFCEFYKDEIVYFQNNLPLNIRHNSTLFTNGLPTVSEPLQNPLTTIAEQFTNGLPTVSEPLQNGLPTVGQKTPNGLPTVSEPLGKKLPTVSEPLQNYS